jgi:hypothetical protein
MVNAFLRVGKLSGVRDAVSGTFSQKDQFTVHIGDVGVANEILLVTHLDEIFDQAFLLPVHYSWVAYLFVRFLELLFRDFALNVVRGRIDVTRHCCEGDEEKDEELFEEFHSV